MDEVRIGVIGLGDMSRWHMRNLRGIPGVKIAAICDISKRALAEVGDELGLPAEKRMSDMEALIKSPEVEGIVSVTPNDSHARIIESCIREGKPLLAEKPLTRTLAEADRVAALYRNSPIPMLINFSYRNGPAFQLAKRWVEEGKLGRVHHLFVQYMQDWGSAVKRTPYVWRFDQAVTGTGTLGDLGSHMLDLAEYIAGDTIAEVQAMLQTIVPVRPDPRTGEQRRVQVDDFACFHARFGNGAIGVFQTSRNALGCGNQHEITLYGERGTLHASTLNDRQLRWTHPASEGGETVTETIDASADGGLDPWAALVGLVRGDRLHPAYAGFEDGYRNQRLLDAVVRAAESRNAVKVE